MNGDASLWLTAGTGVISLVVGAAVRGWLAGRTVVVRADCQAAHRDLPLRIEVAKMIEEEVSRSRHKLRGEFTPIVVKMDERLSALERSAAVGEERHEEQEKHFDQINAKLDRLLDSLPDLLARVGSLERN